jgi:hypothetical protein
MGARFWGPKQTCAGNPGISPFDPCVYRKPYPGLSNENRLSWRDDRADLLRSGRAGLAIQVEHPA